MKTFDIPYWKNIEEIANLEKKKWSVPSYCLRKIFSLYFGPLPTSIKEWPTKMILEDIPQCEVFKTFRDAVGLNGQIRTSESTYIYIHGRLFPLDLKQKSPTFANRIHAKDLSFRAGNIFRIFYDFNEILWSEQQKHQLELPRLICERKTWCMDYRRLFRGLCAQGYRPEKCKRWGWAHMHENPLMKGVRITFQHENVHRSSRSDANEKEQ